MKSGKVAERSPGWDVAAGTSRRHRAVSGRTSAGKGRGQAVEVSVEGLAEASIELDAETEGIKTVRRSSYRLFGSTSPGARVCAFPVAAALPWTGDGIRKC